MVGGWLDRVDSSLVPPGMLLPWLRGARGGSSFRSAENPIFQEF